MLVRCRAIQREVVTDGATRRLRRVPPRRWASDRRPSERGGLDRGAGRAEPATPAVDTHNPTRLLRRRGDARHRGIPTGGLRRLLPRWQGVPTEDRGTQELRHCSQEAALYPEGLRSLVAQAGQERPMSKKRAGLNLRNEVAVVSRRRPGGCVQNG